MKEQTCIISQCPWVRRVVVAQPGSLAQVSHPGATKVLSGATVLLRMVPCLVRSKGHYQDLGPTDYWLGMSLSRFMAGPCRGAAYDPAAGLSDRTSRVEPGCLWSLKRVHKGMHPGRWGSWGHLRGCLPHRLLRSIFTVILGTRSSYATEDISPEAFQPFLGPEPILITSAPSLSAFSSYAVGTVAIPGDTPVIVALVLLCLLWNLPLRPPE